jgi:hypothetical protein
MPFDGTDCSLPMQWAMKEKVAADAFIVLTDNETYSGRMHPVEVSERTDCPDPELPTAWILVHWCIVGQSCQELEPHVCLDQSLKHQPTALA